MLRPCQWPVLFAGHPPERTTHCGRNEKTVWENVPLKPPKSTCEQTFEVCGPRPVDAGRGFFLHFSAKLLCHCAWAAQGDDPKSLSLLNAPCRARTCNLRFRRPPLYP